MPKEVTAMSPGVQNLFNFIETPLAASKQTWLCPQGREAMAEALKKANFADDLSLLSLPAPGDSLYPWLEAINTTHIVYRANKLADEAWMKAMVSEDPKEYEPALNQLNLLKAQVNQYQDDILVAQYTLESDRSLATLDMVREKYKRADEQFFAGHPESDQSPEAMVERAATRLTEFSGVQISSDLDLTMTSSAWYLSLLPHFLQFENFMSKNGRETLPFVMARYAKEALVQFKGLYEQVGKSIPLRPGVHEFFKLTKDLGIPVSVLSANFRAIVSGCLEQIPAVDRDHLVAVTGLQTNSVIAAHKDITTAQRVVANPDLANFICVDGLSDRPCFEGSAEGVTAGVFVLEGTKFMNVVKSTGIPYFAFKDFNDINSLLLQILKKKEIMQSERVYA